MTSSNEHWRDFLNDHGEALLLFARQYTVTLTDAEDALQEAFVRFWRSRSGVHDPLSYLYSCVRTAALDAVRSQRRRDKRELEVARQSQESWFDASLREVDRVDAIEYALLSLPLEQREVLVMRTWAEATFQQIGDVVGVSSKTAAARYRAGIDALCTLFSEDLVP